MVYYGYMHECAELYKQLCKASRAEWNKNNAAIVRVIMKHRQSRFRMEVKKEFSRKAADLLLRNMIYNYFTICISLRSTKSYEAAIYFTNQLDEHAGFLFYNMSARIDQESFKASQEFLRAYLNKGFGTAALQTDYRVYSNHEVQYTKKFHSEYDASDPN
eukprot:CAMPEP_0168348112 /NCGR_PEP_ID=MMETSP0213-20121227/19478_1 /TAXON_ID=151035 /ORGANISM="Euplotes harpa, Strain FSP1.4" /LENGTH=159 /DNA_ID=CAMNT_0008357503 /DNA_START=47 /DNA_END=523 /DNA_ORIENTATION=+